MLKTLLIAAALALTAHAPGADAVTLYGIDTARNGLGVNPERSGLGLKVQERGRVQESTDAAVSVQVSPDGRVAIVTLYPRDCRAPSVVRDGVPGWYDGHVVFDPVGEVIAGGAPRPGDASVRLCWREPVPGMIAVVLYRIVDGVESATDPIFIPRDQFQILPGRAL